MRSLEIAFFGIILMLFFAARIIPVFSWFSGYLFYIVLGVFSYWIPKKFVAFCIVLVEIEIGLKLIFFDWWMYAESINSIAISATGLPLPLSDLEVLFWMIVGISWTFLSRILVYFIVKRRIGRKIKDLLPNIYNMNT